MKKSNQSVAGVYIIRCDASGKVYVGLSVNVNRRWTNHRWHLNRGSHRNAHLQNAWNKHGAAAFTFEIARVITGDDMPGQLAAAEAEVLATYPMAYNLMEPGAVGMVASDETREKLSQDKLHRWSDPDYKARLKDTHLRRHAADPTIAHRRGVLISEAKSTPEAKARTSEQSKAKWAPGGVLRETQGAIRTANWQDPEYRAKQHASRVASAADPEVKARRAAGIKAAWARRKAAAE